MAALLQAPTVPDLFHLSADFVVPAVMVAGVWVMTPGPDWSYYEDISCLVYGTTRTPISPLLRRTPRRPAG